MEAHDGCLTPRYKLHLKIAPCSERVRGGGGGVIIHLADDVQVQLAHGRQGVEAHAEGRPRLPPQLLLHPLLPDGLPPQYRQSC